MLNARIEEKRREIAQEEQYVMVKAGHTELHDCSCLCTCDNGTESHISSKSLVCSMYSVLHLHQVLEDSKNDNKAGLTSQPRQPRVSTVLVQVEVDRSS